LKISSLGYAELPAYVSLQPGRGYDLMPARVAKLVDALL
jgi:hypothetical protein